MPKEIYINTGTSFQQQYIARQPAIGTAPVTAQYDAQGNANSQTAYTYQDRTPYTFRSPVNSQTPYIANKQNPYPYIASNQSSYPANAQNPYPYPASAQQTYPYIAQARQPGTYQATGRTPFTYQARSPSTYARQGQNPFTYQRTGQTPFTYQATGRTPTTYQHRTPATYQRTGQTPFTYQARTPVNYNATGQQPYIYTFEDATGQVTAQPGGKVGGTWTMSGITYSGLNGIMSHRTYGGLKLFWASLNTDWTSCRIGSSSSSYSTITRASMNSTGNTHHQGTHINGTQSSPDYFTGITNKNAAYFALVG